MPTPIEHTAEELNALLGTMSFWARLSARQRDALVADNDDLHQRLGRPIRSSTVTCLVTAGAPLSVDCRSAVVEPSFDAMSLAAAGSLNGMTHAPNWFDITATDAAEPLHGGGEEG